MAFNYGHSGRRELSSGDNQIEHRLCLVRLVSPEAVFSEVNLHFVLDEGM